LVPKWYSFVGNSKFEVSAISRVFLLFKILLKYLWFHEFFISSSENFRFEVIRKEADDENGEGHPLHSLHINFLRQEDSGMFECMAENEAGDIVGYTWLRVKSTYSI